jgi:hypothetical protein
MRVYIDEAGSFLVPPTAKAHSYSLVLALAIPSASEVNLFYEFVGLRNGWASDAVEIKGSKLSESQAAEVIDLLSRYDVLVDFRTIDMVTHGTEVVDDFKARQANGITAYVTPEYDEKIAQRAHNIARTIRGMSNQLFVQMIVTLRLVLEVIEISTAYYAQRQPSELGNIAWIVDRKNSNMTAMEEVWTQLIVPIGEKYFVEKPLAFLEGADYSKFIARYGFTAATMSKEMARHIKWANAAFGMRELTGDAVAVAASRLLSEQRTFEDSAGCYGLQLADMLASILRRALNQHLQFSGWKDFGKLLVRRSEPGLPFMQLGRGDNLPFKLTGYPYQVCLALDHRAKSMIVD